MADAKKPEEIPRKCLPRRMRILLGAVAPLILLGLILPYFLDLDRYRPLVAAEIELATGRKVTLGKIRARILPRVGFVAEDFRLGNPPGFAEGDLLAVESIRGNLALRALLRREIQISSIELVRPKLFLLEDEHARNNYTFAAPEGGTSGHKAGSSAGAAAPGTGFELSAVESVRLTGAEVTLGRSGARGPVPSLRASRVNVTLGRVALHPVQVKRWQGDADLSGARLEFPGWKSPVEFRSGKLTLHGGRLESEFRVALGKSVEWDGKVQVADVERGLATFHLSTPQLDVDNLLAEQEPSEPRRAAHAAKSELIAQGHIAAERIRWENLTANNGSADVRLYTDRIEIWPLASQFYGGTLQVSARADRTQSPERFSTNVQARNIDVGRMLSTVPAARGKLAGTGELDLQLFGALGAQPAKSLSGSGRFTIRDGKLPGLNLTGALEMLARLGGLGPDTPFRVLQGDLTVADGRLSSREIHLESPRGTVHLRGSCSFEGGLNYDGQAVLNPGGTVATNEQNPAEAIAGRILGGVLQQRVGRTTVPFTIRGTLQDPKILPSGAPQFEAPGTTRPGQTGQLPQTQPSKQPPKKKSLLDIFRQP